jgi:hypothetical protein
VAHHLGRLEALLGNREHACAYLERAMEASEAMGAVAFAETSRQSLAAIAGGRGRQ